VVTDKTLQKPALTTLVNNIRERSIGGLDIQALTIHEHPNAPISTLSVGDDILVQADVPSYGYVQLWVRILSIVSTDDDERVQLTTSASSNFLYSSTIEVTDSGSG
jgi:hypothetical protein